MKRGKTQDQEFAHFMDVFKRYGFYLLGPKSADFSFFRRLISMKHQKYFIQYLWILWQTCLEEAVSTKGSRFFAMLSMMLYEIQISRTFTDDDRRSYVDIIVSTFNIDLTSADFNCIVVIDDIRSLMANFVSTRSSLYELFVSVHNSTRASFLTAHMDKAYNMAAAKPAPRMVISLEQPSQQSKTPILKRCHTTKETKGEKPALSRLGQPHQ